MPELPFDVSVAHRFISSLSKSLQALCHGHMDFNSGIEIVGYINVNIDCGSKADYVLNEKVLKSNTNSMTFVSNSFLAKKDQPKQKRDEACSPIPQIQGPLPGRESFQHQPRGGPHGSHYRSGHFHSAHFMRGAHKRGLGAEWRGSAKRHRPVAQHAGQYSSPVPSQHQQSQPFNPEVPGLHPHSSPASSNTTADGGDNLINVKTEAVETGDETQSSSENLPQEASSDFNPGAVNVKTDPDGATLAGGETSAKSESGENGDFKGTFLQPPEANQKTECETENNGQMCESEQQPVGFETPFSNPGTPLSQGGPATPGASNIQQESDHSGEASWSGSQVPGSYYAAVEFDTAAEDTSYSDFAGEGTSSGQFEVIEIDDEDEEMQAMFGTSVDSPTRSLRQVQGHLKQPYRWHKCPQCQFRVPDHSSLNVHLEQVHGMSFPFQCTMCGKGYQTQSGLSRHVEQHRGKNYVCPVCSAKFTQKYHMKTHLRKNHNMVQCIHCLLLLSVEEHSKHREHCPKLRHLAQLPAPGRKFEKSGPRV